MQDVSHLNHELSSGLNPPPKSEPVGLPPTPTSLGATDWEARRSAPRYLSKILIRKLLRSFVDYVHPIVPVIDLLSLQSGTDESPGYRDVQKRDPLVFIAILYAAVPHIDLDDIREAGYQSHAAVEYDMVKDFKVCRILVLVKLLLRNTVDACVRC